MMKKNVNILLMICALVIQNAGAHLNFYNHGRFKRELNRTEDNHITAHLFTQRLDHFSPVNTYMWSQRYWVNDEFFDGSGPIFLYIGGENEESALSVTYSAMVEYALNFKALCVSLEHRYFGMSRPTKNLSTENMIYLSSTQALADLASFRTFIHEKYKLNDSNKWISFGWSYAGSLSAWFRLKYPHLVHAAVSSSAPMKAVVDLKSYMEIVGQSLSKFSPDCPRQIHNGLQKIMDLMKTQSGRIKIHNMFNFCSSVKTRDDYYTFFFNLLLPLIAGVQYNSTMPINIPVVCSIMTNSTVGNTIKRFAAFNKFSLDIFYGQKCLNISYDDSIKILQNVTSFSVNIGANLIGVGLRQWIYLQCINFGYFQSTSSSYQPFGNTMPIEFLLKQCRDIFGLKFNKNLIEKSVNHTNINYGGLDYKGSRVVFTNGDIDPWYPISFWKKPPNNQTEIIFIKGASHCTDMYASSIFDSPSLVSARKKIISILKKWLFL